MDIWKFLDPPNAAVIVNKNAINHNGWIAYVSHDEEDGVWQFHSSNGEENLDQESALVVSLKNIVDIDPSVVDLADLPLGWYAWRSSRNSPWNKAPA